ncbi:MAG: radical SAM protein [Candidatus Woesearchaeota archaeon]
MKTFHLCQVTACKPRKVDLRRIYLYMQSNGLSYSKNYSKADLLVISTCANTQEHEKISLRAIRFYRRKNKKARLIVTGCLPKINPDTLAGLNVEAMGVKELENLDKIIKGPVNFSSIRGVLPDKDFSAARPLFFVQSLATEFQRFQNSIGSKQTLMQLASILNIYGLKDLVRSSWNKYNYPTREKNTYLLEIASGCLGNCSHCAIKRAIGTTKSRPVKEILEEFNEALRQGYKRVHLVADDGGSYGKDIQTDFIDLLESLSKVKGDCRLSWTMNPYWLGKYHKGLLHVILRNPERFSGFQIPIESGSDRLVTLMNRNYTIADAEKKILQIKKLAPHLKIDTVFIVGYPTETEKDFKATLDLLRRLSFGTVVIHAYSDRPGTRASKFEGRVDKATIFKRVQQLEQAQKAIGEAIVCY